MDGSRVSLHTGESSAQGDDLHSITRTASGRQAAYYATTRPEQHLLQQHRYLPRIDGERCVKAPPQNRETGSAESSNDWSLPLSSVVLIAVMVALIAIVTVIHGQSRGRSRRNPHTACHRRRRPAARSTGLASSPACSTGLASYAASLLPRLGLAVPARGRRFGYGPQRGFHRRIELGAVWMTGTEEE
ncbi:hypothetical protein LTR02_008969 [Friedmanniomyces endolithicus]|nr:hypothetical protein LTR02_008969 [Friedmanniomyces endolithicus]